MTCRSLSLIAAPVDQLLTLDEIKAHIRVDGAAEDNLITQLLNSAVETAQNYTSRQFMRATYEALYDGLPRGFDPLRLPRAPVQEITSLTYHVGSTWTSTALDVDTLRILAGPEAAIAPALGTSWPQANAGPQAVKVRYVAGYADADHVPAPIKQAVLLQIGSMYEDRGELIVGTSSGLRSDGIARLLSAYRVNEVA